MVGSIPLLDCYWSIFFQCGDDDHVDAEKPVISVSTPLADAIVHGQRTVQATAADNNEVTDLQLFIDNMGPVCHGTSVIDYLWDTYSYPDGVHTLRFVATDTEGNTTETSVNVTIRNTLLTFAMPSNYIPAGVTYWLIVSDDKGATLDYQTIGNGDTYKFLSPQAFAGETLTLTVLRQSDVAYSTTTLFSYTNIPFGNYGYSAKVPTDAMSTPPIKGTSYISFADAPGIDYFSKLQRSYGTGVAFSNATGINGNQGLRIGFSTRYDKSAVLLTRNISNEISYLYQVLEPNLEYAHSIKDFIEADIKTITVPQSDNISMTLYGTSDYGKMSILSSLTLPVSGNTIEAPYPSGIFSEFVTTLTANYGDRTLVHIKSDAELPNSMKAINANLTFSMNGSTITRMQVVHMI